MKMLTTLLIYTILLTASLNVIGASLDNAQSSINEHKVIIFQNPSGDSAIYINGKKIAEAKELSASPGIDTGELIRGALGDATSNPTPSPSPSPSGGRCGDLPCPEPTPTPTPSCTGPACPGGMPFFSNKGQLIYYRNNRSVTFPESFDPQKLPSALINPGHSIINQ